MYGQRLSECSNKAIYPLYSAHILPFPLVKSNIRLCIPVGDLLVGSEGLKKKKKLDSVYATGRETVANTTALSLRVHSSVRIEAKPPSRSTASVLKFYLRHQNYDHHAGVKQSAGWHSMNSMMMMKSPLCSRCMNIASMTDSCFDICDRFHHIPDGLVMINQNYQGLILIHFNQS